MSDPDQSVATPADHPPGSLEALRARYGERHKWLVLMTVMIGTIASVMSSTIVNVAIPDMSRSFELGQERAQWVSGGFMAAMSLSMLLTPWLLARLGSRRTYTGAVALLMCGGIIGGMAGNYPLVLAMRVVEGLAAGVLQPIPAIIILRSFAHEEQGRASGIFGFGVVLAPAIGPSVGGFLVDAFGWRAIFFVVVPFCAIAMLMAQRYLSLTSASMNTGRRFDGLGFAVAGVMVLCLMNGLVALHGGLTPTAQGLLAAVPVLLTAFLMLERRVEDPLLDLRVFGWQQFTMGSMVSFIYGMALFGSTYLVPVYMQMALGYAPTQAGLVLLPAGVVLALTIPVAGRLADRLEPRLLVSVGLLLLGLSFALMPIAEPGTGFWLLMALAMLGRLGLGCVLPSLNIGAMRGIERSLIPEASSAVSLLRQLGGAIGISVAGTLLEWRLASYAAEATHRGMPVKALQMHAYAEIFLLFAAISLGAMLAAMRMAPREHLGSSRQ